MTHNNLYSITYTEHSAPGKEFILHVCAINIVEAVDMASKLAPGRDITSIQKCEIRPYTIP